MGPDLRDLGICIQRAFAKLEEMNKRSAPRNSGYGHGWTVANIRNLEEQGVRFTLQDGDGGMISAAHAAELAYELIRGSEALALIHGDANLDSILARDDREAVLIDFQLCGAGRPLYEVWHLAVAVLSGFLRPVTSEADLATTIRLALTPGTTIKDVRAAHPGLLLPECNGLCFEALQCARDALRRLIALHELPTEHLQAMGAVVAAYALTLRHPKVVTARALLQAVVPELMVGNESRWKAIVFQ